MSITSNEFLEIKYSDGILYFTTLKGTPNEVEWAESQIMVDTWYNFCEKHGIKVGLIFDLKTLIFIKPSFLVDWVECFRCNAARTEKYVIASAIIIENIIIRQFINIFFSIYKNIKPTKIVSSINDGLQFIKMNTP